MTDSIPVSVTRRENLKAWCAQFKTDTAAAEALDMSGSQLSQIAGPNPTRNIGTKVARRIEKMLNQPPGWLDTRHIVATHPQLEQAIVRVRNMANAGKLTAHQIDTVRGVIDLVTAHTPYEVIPAQPTEAEKKASATL